jgi:ribonucleotide monophosphatase NagD (HAD superfamily)
MGKESGMAAGLVLTGVTDEKSLAGSAIRPDHVFRSIADVEELINAE